MSSNSSSTSSGATTADHSTPITIPHLKAYDRSLRAAAAAAAGGGGGGSGRQGSTPDGSPAKPPPPAAAVAAAGPVFAGLGFGRPTRKLSMSGSGGGGGAGGGGGSRFLSRALCVLFAMLLLSIVFSVNHFGMLSAYLRTDELSRSPTVAAMLKREVEQSEQLTQLLQKLDGISNETTRLASSLAALRDATQGQKEAQGKALEELLKVEAQRAGREGGGDAVPASAVVETGARISNLVQSVQEQVRQLSDWSKEAYTKVEEGLRSRGTGEGEQRGGESDGRESAAPVIAKAVEQVSAAAEAASAKQRDALEQLQQRLLGLSTAIDGLPAVIASKVAEGKQGLDSELSARHRELVEKGEKVLRFARKQGQKSKALLRLWAETGADASLNTSERAGALLKLFSDEPPEGEREGEGTSAAAPAAGTLSLADAEREEERRQLQQRCATLEEQVRLQNETVVQLQSKLENATKQLQSNPAALSLSSDDDGPAPTAVGGVDAYELRTWHNGKLMKAGGYGFVSFSTYRISQNAFASVGFGLTVLHDTRLASTCVWTSGQSRVRGKARLSYPRNTRNAQYETLLLLCEFTTSTATAGIGGHLSAYVNHELVLLYREDADQYSKSVDPLPPFNSTVTLCAPPLYGRKVEPLAVRQFVEYHRLLGVDRFTLYDSGVAHGLLGEALRPSLRSGVLEIVDFRDLRRFDIWNYGQMVALHDCVFRHRYDSQWVLYQDIDNYLWLPLPPPASTSPALDLPSPALQTFLQPYRDRTGITVGSLWFSINKCRPRQQHVAEVLRPALFPAGSATSASDTSALDALTQLPAEEAAATEFAVERFVLRWPKPACFAKEPQLNAKMCLGQLGHRKFFVNPRKVERVTPFGPLSEDRKAAGAAWADISTDDVVNLHYRRLGFGTRSTVCNETTRTEETVQWWSPGQTYARGVAALRRQHRCNFAANGCVPLDTPAVSQDTAPFSGDDAMSESPPNQEVDASLSLLNGTISPSASTLQDPISTSATTSQDTISTLAATSQDTISTAATPLHDTISTSPTTLQGTVSTSATTSEDTMSASPATALQDTMSVSSSLQEAASSFLSSMSPPPAQETLLLSPTLAQESASISSQSQQESYAVSGPLRDDESSVKSAGQSVSSWEPDAPPLPTPSSSSSSLPMPATPQFLAVLSPPQQSQQSNSAQDFQSNLAQGLQSNSAQGLQSNSAQGLQSNSAQVLQSNSAQVLQSNSAQGLQSNSAQGLQSNSAQGLQSTSSQSPPSTPSQFLPLNSRMSSKPRKASIWA